MLAFCRCEETKSEGKQRYMKSLAFFLSMALGFTAFGHGVQVSDPQAGLEREVLGQFEVDLKAGTIHGLKDIAIRVSSDSMLELRIAELILQHTTHRVIHCLACRKDQTDQKRIAKLSGIENFLDVRFEGDEVHQSLALRISRASDQKEVWAKTYAYDEEENVDTQVEVVRPIRFTGYVVGGWAPQELRGVMASYGLGFGAQYRGFGLELEDTRTREVNTLFHLMVAKIWKMKTREDQFWIATGASYLTSNAASNLGWAIRAGYDYRFSRQWTVGGYLGGQPWSRYSGIEGALRIGFIF
jgi:hypothetical protein